MGPDVRPGHRAGLIDRGHHLLGAVELAELHVGVERLGQLALRLAALAHDCQVGRLPFDVFLTSDFILTQVLVKVEVLLALVEVLLQHLG